MDKKKMSKEMMEKLMSSKKSSSSKEPSKENKMNVLKDISREMKDMMGSEMDSMKKVTVAAKDDEGLLEGLDKAGDILKKKDMEDED